MAALLLTSPATALAYQPPPNPPEETGEAPEEPAPAPKLLLKCFGNIDFEKRWGGTPNSFLLGELDVFLTSELAEELSVLAEVVFEQSEGDEPIIDIERYQIKYSPSDSLNVALGRMHTTLGHWNQTYHHGTWFQTTAFRPEIYQFEDNGGVLPVHEVGVQVFGTKALPGLQLDYNLSLANGRGATRTRVEAFQDRNSNKAVNLWLRFAPSARPGLKLGGVAHIDTIPSDPANPDRASEIRERIVGGFVVYQQAHVEILAEWLRISHEEHATDRTFRTVGLYVQGSYAFGRFKPYYRFDALDIADGDPFYAPDHADIRKHTAGLRIDPWTWAGIKLELSHSDPDPGSGFAAAALQVAFTF